MAFVPVPKDLTKVRTKVAFNLTKRQIICFGMGALLGLPSYFLTRPGLGNEGAALCCLFLHLGFMRRTGSRWKRCCGISSMYLSCGQRDGLTGRTTVMQH